MTGDVLQSEESVNQDADNGADQYDGNGMPAEPAAPEEGEEEYCDGDEERTEVGAGIGKVLGGHEHQCRCSQ